MKGIILAGGTGSRLSPITKVVSKQLLPVYDKPMIYYPLSILMLAGINDILIICNRRDLLSFQELFGNGSDLGLSITYEVQKKPEGISQAFIIGEDFINEDPVCLILGDNIFYGDGLPSLLKDTIDNLQISDESSIFAYKVSNPSDYGVVSFDVKGKVLSIEEKPKNPKSKFAAVGLYFYPGDVSSKAKSLTKSQRGEYEITDLNKSYRSENRLNVQLLGRGTAWLDTGTHETLIAANNFVSTIESRQGLKIACPEEISFRNGWISKKNLLKLADQVGNSQYADYLRGIVDE
ncbi:MAG: glucose-1-phosphate thymidylyltransferase RfbA [Gammaproteobacteria bacterium]